MIVKIIIMTKSFKHGGHCIAGINAQNGEWIRLVTSNPITEGAVPDVDARYFDMTSVEVLDCVEVDLIKAVPTTAQTENWLYNPQYAWKFIKRYTIDEVINLHPLDISEPIFGSSDNYCTPFDLDGNSLLLVKVNHPSIEVIRYEYYNKTKVYFNFYYNKKYYSHFSVSDRNLYSTYVQERAGNYSLNDGYAVLSLTGAWIPPDKKDDIRHYKMLAQFFSK